MVKLESGEDNIHLVFAHFEGNQVVLDDQVLRSRRRNGCWKCRTFVGLVLYATGLGKNRVSARPNRVILYADMMRISDPVSMARSGKIMKVTHTDLSPRFRQIDSHVAAVCRASVLRCHLLT